MSAAFSSAIAKTPLLAHVVDAAGPTPEDVWRHWTLEWWVLLPLALSAGIYARGVVRLWRRAGRGHGITRFRASLFALGWVFLFVALVTPVDAMGGVLFSAHMVQHLLLMMVAAPLMVLGAPQVAFLWSLPDRLRRPTGRGWRRSRMLRPAVLWTLTPLPAWTIHTLAIWGWHAPGPYEAALKSDFIHGLEHVSFFGSAVIAWWVVALIGTRQGLGHGAGILYLFATMMQGALLGVLITFAPRPWYTAHEEGAAAWGLTLLEDQQLAGLLMWVPSGVIFTFAAVVVFLGWMRAADRAVRRHEAVADSMRQRAANEG